MTDAEHPDADPAFPVSGLEDASDADLIQRVRAGDSAAYEHLFLRHRDVAIRYARRISDAERAEDLCAEAFTKILDLLQRGKGPDVAFRAYLLTTVRTSHLNTIRAGSREDLVPDHEPISRMSPTIEDPDARFDASAIYRAFDKLPERWQTALWLTSVEGLSNEEASEHLGVRVNAVASLAFRARAGLRQAYLNEHLLETTDPQCRRVVELLPSYFGAGLSNRRRATVEAHLATCTDCTKAALEVSEVNGRLGAVLAPLVLAGSAGGAVLGGTVLGSVAGTVKSAVTSVILQAKATGTALSGALGAKAAVAATATVLGVAVGADVMDRDAGGPADPTTEREVAPRRPALAAPSLSPTAGATPTSRAYVATPQVPDTPARPTGTPAARPTRVVPVTPAPSPTPTPTTEAAPTSRTSVEQPTSQSYQQYGLRWERVVVPVTNPVEDTFLVITVSRTLETALATTTGSGWVCGTPVTDWFDGRPYATSTISCMHTGNGDGGPLRFDYRVASGSVLTAALTTPPGTADTHVSDNLRQLLLR